MPNFTIANKIELANPHANLDVLYGPYQDLLEAKATVVSVLREKGLTVGVYESGAVVEYWWKSGTADADLIAKTGKDVMLERDYTGTGTKSVNRAVSSQYAGQANADILGRTIHETYALKDSGITPPVNETVDLNNDTPTYTVTDATAPLLSVTNAADADGEVILPTNLTADKSISIQIFRNETIINGVTYSDGDTVFASFEYDTASWYITDTEIPEIPDYSDMTVDAMIENPTITPKPGYIRITGHVWIIGTKVFLRTTDTPTPTGIYQCVGAGAGYSNLVLITAGTALHTVRVKDGDVWYSQYDGKNAGTLFFERITVEKVAITKQGFNGELSPVVYPVDRQRTVIGYKLGSNATDFSVTINSVNYTKADVTNVVVPVNTEITINDVTIAVGKDTGNVVLILK